MLIWGSLMMIVTLAQRLVIVTLAQRLSDSSTLEEDGDPCVVDRQSEDGQDDSTAFQQTYHILLMTLHLSRVVTLVRTHTC
jgi:hypothetical protein